LREWYGFAIGAAFSGVVGVGFYPIMGNRVWCHAPWPPYWDYNNVYYQNLELPLMVVNVFCGNCSTIAKWELTFVVMLKRENIVRSSCVGCGICAAVCPRGVLKLENDTPAGRINSNEILLNDVNLMDLLNNRMKKAIYINLFVFFKLCSKKLY
jgi:ferredoxin